MPGGLPCSSLRLRSRYRYLAPNSLSSPAIVCASLVFSGDTRVPRELCVFSTSASRKSDNGATSDVKEMGLPTKGTHIINHRQRKANTKNIFVDDLKATLEAHRATNVAKLIHKIELDATTGLTFKRIKLPPSTGPISPSTSSQTGTDVSPPNTIKIEVLVSEPDPAARNATEEPPNASDPSISVPKAPFSEKSFQDYKGRYRVVRGEWQPKRGSFVRSRRQIPLNARVAVDLDEQSIKPTATDTAETNKRWRPWMKHLEVEESDGMLRLNQEIKAFETYMKPTPKEENAAQLVITFAQSVVAAVAPSSVLTVHGSRRTALASPLSDIDFSVSIPEYEKDLLKRGPSVHRPEARRAGMRLLKSIEYALKKSLQCSVVQFVHARVNLVTAMDLNTQLQLQFQTLAPFRPALEYSMYYLAEFPGLRPLYVLLRHYLLMRDLTGARYGGIGSYPLLIMIVTALKHSHLKYAPEDLGRQLLIVLKFWSTADLYKYGYAADPPTRFTKVSHKLSLEERQGHLGDPFLEGIDIIRKPKEDLPYLLCLQDPGNPTNDLGKHTVQIKNIQACFSTSRNQLLQSLTRWQTLVEYGTHQKGGLYSFLEPLLGADYSVFEGQRRDLAKPHISKSLRLFKTHKTLSYARKQPTDHLLPETERGTQHERPESPIVVEIGTQSKGQDDSIVATSDEPDPRELIGPSLMNQSQS